MPSLKRKWLAAGWDIPGLNPETLGFSAATDAPTATWARRIFR